MSRWREQIHDKLTGNDKDDCMVMIQDNTRMEDLK